jgi:hypothetical protein
MNPQLEELACLFILDRLDAQERAAFEARLTDDRDLADLVRELESSLSRHIHDLPRHEPPAGMLADIEARIDALSAARRPAPTALPWASIARWGIAAVIALGIGTIAVQSLRRAPAEAARPFMIVVGLDSNRSTLAELPMQGRAQDADARFIQLASLAERFWEKPGDMPAKIEPTGQGGLGYALFDPGSNQGFIAIRQLPSLDKGERYHLWLLDTASGLVREAGTLPATDSSRGLFFFSVAPAAGAKPGRLDFFVTAEDSSAPDSGHPRGKIVLGDRRI